MNNEIITEDMQPVPQYDAVSNPSMALGTNNLQETRTALQQHSDSAGQAVPSGTLPQVDLFDSAVRPNTDSTAPRLETAQGSSQLERQAADQAYPTHAQPGSTRYQGADAENWTSYTAYDSQGRFWRQVTRDGGAYTIRYDQAGQGHYIPITRYNPANDDYAPVRPPQVQQGLLLDGLGELTQGPRDAVGTAAHTVLVEGTQAPRDFVAQPDKPAIIQVPLDALQSTVENDLQVLQTVGGAFRAVDPGSIVVRTLAGEEQISNESFAQFQNLLLAIKTNGVDSREAQNAAEAYNSVTRALREEGVFAAADRNPSLVPAEITVNIAESILGAGIISELTFASRSSSNVARAAELSRPVQQERVVEAAVVARTATEERTAADGAAQIARAQAQSENVVRPLMGSVNRTHAPAGSTMGDVYHDLGLYSGRDPMAGLEGVLREGRIQGHTSHGAEVSQNGGPTNWAQSRITLRVGGTPDDFPNLGLQSGVDGGAMDGSFWYQTGSRQSALDITGKPIQVIVNGSNDEEIAALMLRTQEAVQSSMAARAQEGLPAMDVKVVSIRQFLAEERFPEFARALPPEQAPEVARLLAESPLNSQRAVGEIIGKMPQEHLSDAIGTWRATLDETRETLVSDKWTAWATLQPGSEHLTPVQLFDRELDGLSLAEQITLAEAFKRKPNSALSNLMSGFEHGKSLKELVDEMATAITTSGLY